MNWMQKLQALNAIAECSLKMRSDTSWYVSQQIDIKDKSFLTSVTGNGDNPEEAVEDHWKQATAGLQPHQYIVGREYMDGNLSRRTAVRWNGFMWEPVSEPTRHHEAAA